MRVRVEGGKKGRKTACILYQWPLWQDRVCTLDRVPYTGFKSLLEKSGIFNLLHESSATDFSRKIELLLYLYLLKKPIGTNLTLSEKLTAISLMHACGPISKVENCYCLMITGGGFR